MELRLLSSGQLYGWSIYPSYLGIGTSGFLAEIALLRNLYYWTPTWLSLLRSPISIPTRFCSYALLTDSTIWAWGDNAMGNIGNGVELNYAKYATSLPLMAPLPRPMPGIGVTVSSCSRSRCILPTDCTVSRISLPTVETPFMRMQKTSTGIYFHGPE